MQPNSPPQSHPAAGYGTAPAQQTDDRLPIFEIRPDAATFWRGVGTRALIFLPIIAIGIYRSTSHGIGSSFLLYCGLAVVLVFAALTMLQTSSLVLTATTVEKHRRWLAPTVVQRTAVASGVFVPHYQSAFNRTVPLLILAGRNGRPLLRLTGPIYTAADLYTFAQRFGYAYFDVLDDVAGPKVVAKRHPKLIPLIERRPVLVTVMGFIVLLVAIVVGVSVFNPAV